MPLALEIAIWFVAINWGGTLLFFVYPLGMMWVFKDFTFDGFHGPFAKFKLADKAVEKWHARMWQDWWGVGLHWFMCYQDTEDEAQMTRGVLHEGAHCWHGVILGLMFWVFYVGHVALIFVTQKIRLWWIVWVKEESVVLPYTKHPYYDCWSERLARKRAGQLIDIPPEQWPEGARDLIPWF